MNPPEVTAVAQLHVIPKHLFLIVQAYVLTLKYNHPYHAIDLLLSVALKVSVV